MVMFESVASKILVNLPVKLVKLDAKIVDYNAPEALIRPC